MMSIIPWPLRHYNGLKNLVEYGQMAAYHGTTANFDQFDMKLARQQLVNQFYGAGLFFVPEKSVAWDYAYANRNYGFPVSIINDIAKTKPNLAAFIKQLYDNGYTKGWEIFLKQKGGYDWFHQEGGTLDGIDLNDANDIAEYIAGSKSGKGHSSNLHDLFAGSTLSIPDYAYDTLTEWGMDASKYRPKVYTVVIRNIQNVLTTDSLNEAKLARARGHDAVIYYGDQIVNGIPEIAIFNPENIVIIHKEVAE